MCSIYWNTILPVLVMLSFAFHLHSATATNQNIETNIEEKRDVEETTAELLAQLAAYDTDDDIIDQENVNNNSNANETVTINSTQTDLDKNVINKIKLQCIPVNRTNPDELIPSVIHVNSSTISKYLRVERNYTSSSANRSSSGNSTSSLLKPGLCTAVIFYLEWCPFSAEAAPHFNALGRLFPQMRIIAIDAYSLYSATIRYGVVSVPSLYIFHNNKLVSKFNRSETRIDQLVEYIQSITTLEAIDEVALNESDFLGPLSNQVVHSFNYVLALSWIFVALVAIYYFARSDLFRKLKESVSNMWNEALFQHEHID